MKTLKGLFISFILLLATATAYAAPVDINTADVQTLAASIKGVGEKKAQAIVDYREKHGPFTSADELTNVKGIGTAIVEKNRDNLLIKQKTN